MKILQTPPRFYPCVGGVEYHVYYIAKEMVKQGHRVTVVCANEPQGDAEESIAGINVRRLNYVGKIAGTNITPSLPFRLLNTACDVIHTHLPTPWSADWSAIVSRLKRIPLVVTYHNDIVGHGVMDYVAKLYNSTSLKFLLNAADKIVVTQPNYLRFSPHLREYSDKFAKKFVVIPAGVDTDEFKPMGLAREKEAIFFLSVLNEYHEYKGLDCLLEALALVRNEVKDVKLIIGGEGRLLNHYRSKAKSLGLEDNVEFHGFIPQEKLVEYYNKCSVFVLPSISSAQEGFGVAVVEALACATPVICTDIVGVASDVRTHNVGIVVPPKDSESLGTALIKLLKDDNRAREMGTKGRELAASKYAWQSIAAKIMAVYEELVHKRR